MLDTFLAQVERCSPVKLFNRSRISLEMSLAPAEIALRAAPVRERGAKLPEVAAAWLGRMETLMTGDGRPVEAYVRRTVTEGASWYAAPGTPAERAGRTIVFAYTGDANRLFMPAALFLQSCPADRYEFVVFYDFQHALFMKGIAGLAPDLPGSIERIAAIVGPSRYRHAMSFGTSAGGLAAVWTAVALGFDRAVSVGGVTPNEIASRVQTQGLSTDGFAEAIRRADGRLPDVLLVAGEDAGRDRRKALTMTGFLPATEIVVPGTANHNVLYDLWSRGELRPFLERVLAPPAVRRS